MAHLIDKSAVVAEIERRLELNDTCQKISGGNEFYRGAIDEAKEILSLLDTLEVKEVDLEKELKEFLRQYYNYDYPKQYQDGTGSNTMPHIVETAKYFFNLGLKVQKREEI